MSLGNDQCEWMPCLQLGGVSAVDRVASFRDHLLLRGMDMYGTAKDFLESIDAESPVAVVRETFVAATLVVENAMRCATASGLVTRSTNDSARKMLEEMRFQARRSLEAVEQGVQKLEESNFSEKIQGASSRIDWLWRLAEQTLQMRRKDLAAQLTVKAPSPQPSF